MTRESPLDGILVNVVLVVPEVLTVANPVISESALPDLSLSPKDRAERVRVTAFD
jgi:hypothetical protein